MKTVSLLENDNMVKAYCFNPKIDYESKTIRTIAITKKGIYPDAIIINGRLHGKCVPWFLPASVEDVTIRLGFNYRQAVRLANEI